MNPKHEQTKQKIALYLETIGVPNRERLNTKNEEFIFDLGVYIVSPILENESLKEIREQMDFILNYDSFDAAADELEKRNKERGGPGLQRFLESVMNGTLGNGISVQVLDLSGRNDSKGMSEKEFDKRVKEAKLMPSNKKISELLAIANKLGKDLSDSKQFDRLSDLDKFHNDWFNEVYVFMTDLMSDDHYKGCGCVAIKYDTFTSASNRKEALENWGGAMRSRV